MSATGDGGRRDEDRRDEGRRGRQVRGSMVPEAEFRSYYGRPIIKEPVWTWEVPWYFFAGGLAGARPRSGWGRGWPATTGWPGRVRGGGRRRRRRRALLASDLGRPERFLYMLQVFKVTSPLSVGSWILAAMGPAAVGAVISDRLGIFPRLGRAAEVVAGLLGPALATTPAPWSPTRPCRSGTRAAASCRSCSPAAPPPAPARPPS